MKILCLSAAIGTGQSDTQKNFPVATGSAAIYGSCDENPLADTTPVGGFVVDLQLKNRVALVTDSTTGIGFAIGSGLAGEGAIVIINGRTEKRTT